MPSVQTHLLRPSDKHPANDQIYCGLDAMITLECFEALAPDAARAQGIYNFERALQAPLLEMSLRGFKIDEYERQQALQELSVAIHEVYSLLQQFSEAVWSAPLNPRSPGGRQNQMARFFYDAMGLPEIWTFDKGTRKLSMNRETLEKLSDYFYARPVVSAILSCRDLMKLRGAIKTEIDPDSRWRTSYSWAETGRLRSSSSAFGTGGNIQNLQNDDYDNVAPLPSLRKMFIADDGFKLCNIDLEQTESFDVGWLHGTLLGDWKYLDACENSGDLHSYSASLVWPELRALNDLFDKDGSKICSAGTPWQEFSVENKQALKINKAIAEQPFYRYFSHRYMAKRGGHLTNYYGTAYTASKHLKIPLGIAEKFQVRYALGDNAAFPAFPRWWQWCAQELQTKQVLITPFGRERQFFGRPREDTTLREAIAFVPQSCTADRMNLGLWRIWHELSEVLGVQILAQVHDSVCFQFPEGADEEEVVSAALALTRVPQHHSPSARTMTVAAEAKVGWNWGEYHEKLNPNGLKKRRAREKDRRERKTVRIM